MTQFCLTFSCFFGPPLLVVPYLNYSTFSEPDETHGHHLNTMPHCLDPFDEEDWDLSMTSSLPTEFNLRPDVTPTGEEAHPIVFETPAVRASPSHNASLSDADFDNFDDETGDRLSELQNAKYTSSKIGSQSILKKEVSGGKKPANKVYVIVRTSILSSLLLLLLFSCLVILIIESESDLLSHLRKLPEMVILRRDYYEPIKNSLFHAVKR